MRIATYNLNNLFERAKVFEFEGFSSEAKAILTAYNKLAEILPKDNYSEGDKTIIAGIIEDYVEVPKSEKYIEINQVRGKLYTYNAQTKKATIKASGNNEWLGWPELVKKEVNEVSTQNTAKVLIEVKADILCIVEVENRIALENFNKYFLNNQYKYSMLIDGNDDRGIDVGIYSNYDIVNIESHIFDSYTSQNNQKIRIFSRDCAIYTIRYNNKRIYMLCNHLKSKGYGSQVSNDRRRKRQAERIKEILQNFDLTTDYVVVAGDLNDTPDKEPLKPLLNVPGLHNVIAKKLPVNERGTYLHKKDQLDYLLVSTPLLDSCTNVQINRRGIFKSNKPDMIETVTSVVNHASDHAAVLADFNL